MAMRIPMTDYEWRRPDPGVTEEEFHARKDLYEGVSGRDALNAKFENTERTQVLSPRGDKRGRPMPRNAEFCEADNHGEWGLDHFVEALEYGADGPRETRPYHGLGLPSKVHYSANANPAFECCEEDAFAGRPLGQGVGKKDM
jgi:hypothetical protein